MEPSYRLYALKYAETVKRQISDNFLMTGDLHDGPMPMDFFCWVAISGANVVLIDCGADEETCSRRGYRFIRSPVDALSAINVNPLAVTDVVLTHLHWDHAGNLAAFPNARIIVQRQEVAYATGPAMCSKFLRRPFDCSHVCNLIQALYGGRVVFNQGDLEIHPGLTAHLVGGHTPGLQVVRVNTDRGHVVVASDAVHFYANAINENPFPVLVNVQDYLGAHRRIVELADSAQHIIAGHDPIVRQSFPAQITSGIEVIELHKDPLSALPVIA